MAIGVDTSKWKPRKIIGTPASKFRNILGVGILTVGMITGVFFHTKLYRDGLNARHFIPADLTYASSTYVTEISNGWTDFNEWFEFVADGLDSQWGPLGGAARAGQLSNSLDKSFTPITKNLRESIEVLYEDPIEEVERRQMIASGLPNRTGDAIRKYMEESQRPDQPGL